MAGTGIYGELLKAQLENLASDPASTSVGRLYWNTTTQSARIYTSSGWDDFGAGGGGAAGRNYLTDWFDGDRDPGSVTNSITATGNITISTTAWQASDTSKLTVARTSSSPLRQTYSILLDHVATGAAFVQTPCFLLDAADLGKPVTVSFDVANVVTSDDYQAYVVRYTSGGTYQEQIPIIGTASATSPYSARIPTGTTKFQGFFIAGSTSTDYYVIRFYRNSASDTTDIKVDSLYAGPEKVVQGAAVTDWVSYTPTNSNSTNATTGVHYRRVGDSLELIGRVSWSGAGSGSTMTLTLPTGLTVDSSKIAGGSSTDVYFGPGQFFDSGTAVTQLSVYYASSTTIGFWFSSANVSFDGSQGASGDVLTFNARIPITGWSSNVTMADRAVERYYATSDTWDAAGSTTIESVKGQQMGGALTASRSKVITYNHVASPTDKIAIELSWDGVNWIDSSKIAPYQLSTAGGDLSGVYLSASSTTSATVTFAQYRSAANDDSPTSNWLNSMYWRLRVTSGGAAVGYPIHADNIIVDHNTTQVSAAIESGTYTPTFTNVSNVASTTLRSARYMRVGNVVSVAIQVAIATTAAAPTATQMRVTVPIASNFTTEYQASGGGARFRSTAANEALYIETDSTNNELDVYFYSTITSASDTSIHFTYEIV